MSHTQQLGPRVEYASETLRIDHPAPLRAPSAGHQAEALRRHLAGDTTPLRSDGADGWSSLIGLPMGFAHKGIVVGPVAEPEIPLVPDAVDQLQLLLAQRAKLQTQRAHLQRVLADAREAEAAAKQRIADLDDRDTAAWAQCVFRSKSARHSDVMSATDSDAMSANPI